MPSTVRTLALSRFPLCSLLELLLVLAVLGYVTTRAALLSITHDEALTFMAFCTRPFAELLSYQSIGASPNNHLLNTLLAAASINIFGLKEITLRLPALFGAVLYCLGIWGAVRVMCQGWAKPAALSLCLANAYLLDFFSLARGYGLALGFTALGFFFLCRRRATCALAHSFFAASCLALAALANLAFLNVYLPSLLILAALEIRDLRHCLARWPRWIWRCLLALGPSAGLLAAVYVVPIQLLNANGQFFFGGTTGFFHDTLASLLRAYLYAPKFETADLTRTACALAALVLVAGLAAAYAARQTRSLSAFASSPGGVFLALAVAAACSIALQHALLGSRLVIERAAIYFYPMAGLAISGLAAFVIEHGARRAKLCAAAFLAVLAAAALAYALSQANLTHTRDWRYGACTRAMALQIAAGGKTARVVTNSLYAPGLVFYIAANNWYWMDWRSLDERLSPATTHYLLARAELDALAAQRPLARVAFCPVSDMQLAVPAP